MKAPATPRLGQRGEDAWVDFFGMGFASQVDLLPDEVPLQAWDAGLVDSLFSSAWGGLYLTTERLIWIRWRFAAPWVQKTMIVNLKSVAGSSVGRSLKLGLGLRQFVTVALKDGREMRFWPPSYGARPEQIAGEIGKVLRERGLLDA
jgi:hypothetical protein